jgi:DNA polymerase (family 10)
VLTHNGVQLDLRVVPPESYGNLLQHFTGSKEHNLALREDSVRRGLSVSEYGITEVENGEVFTAESEEQVYERLGYAYIPPELRENSGEL